MFYYVVKKVAPSMLSNINFETKKVYEKNAPITKRETFFIPF